MQVTAQVLSERVRAVNGVEYIETTCMEQGTSPLLQMFDYSLRPDEKSLKGTLQGKTVVMQWENIRAIFSGRPQINGKLLSVGGKALTSDKQ